MVSLAFVERDTAAVAEGGGLLHLESPTASAWTS
jgi:hypothetical protein